MTPANRPVNQMRGPSLDCPAMVKEMTLQMPHWAHISRTSTFARTIGPYRLRCRLGARFRSSPNIDNPSFRSRCKALSLKCVELQRKAILNEHGHRKVLQRPEGLRLHSARRWRQGRIRPRHCARACRHPLAQQRAKRSPSTLRKTVALAKSPSATSRSHKLRHDAQDLVTRRLFRPCPAGSPGWRPAKRQVSF